MCILHLEVSLDSLVLEQPVQFCFDWYLYLCILLCIPCQVFFQTVGARSLLLDLSAQGVWGPLAPFFHLSSPVFISQADSLKMPSFVTSPSLKVILLFQQCWQFPVLVVFLIIFTKTASRSVSQLCFLLRGPVIANLLSAHCDFSVILSVTLNVISYGV